MTQKTSGPIELKEMAREKPPAREFKSPGPVQSAWLMLERLINGITTSAYNPFYYLGAISIFFLWIILVSGIYLFLFYNITARGAYASVQDITHGQWYLGGVMRSLHRYASDGLVITMLLHALRCYTMGMFKHWRWLPWVSGIVIAWIVWIGGIFGYWMVWDVKAQLVALLSSGMLENIPIFGLPLSTNFARIENLTDQLFYIILFIHFSSIFFLFLLILVHLMRTTKSVINPPRAVAYGIIVVLLAISFIKPATSAAPADLKALPQNVPFDWFYMFIFPALKFMSPKGLWGFIVAVTGIIAAVPWLTRTPRKPAAEVKLANCTGCELCMEDCPYVAIQMRPRTDGMPYPLEAVVINSKCASCGICVGSCDYKAINLPDISEDAMKESIRRLCADMREASEPGSVMVFACAKGAWLNGAIEGNRFKEYPWARVIELPCIGMLQPSMLAIPFERGVDGVYVAGCRQGDCHYRRGNDWFLGRLAGIRPPVVKRSVDKSRVRSVMLSAVEKDSMVEGLVGFHNELKGRRGE